MPEIAKLKEDYYFNFDNRHLICLKNNKVETIDKISGHLYTVLRHFCSHPYETISSDQIAELVWGKYYDPEEARKVVQRLRKRLKNAAKGLDEIILTGYEYIGERTEVVPDNYFETLIAKRKQPSSSDPQVDGGNGGLRESDEIETETVYKAISAAINGADFADYEFYSTEVFLEKLNRYTDGYMVLELMGDRVNKHVRELEKIQERLDRAKKEGNAGLDDFYSKQFSINQDLLNRTIDKYNALRKELEAKAEEIKEIEGTKVQLIGEVSYPSSGGVGGIKDFIGIDWEEDDEEYIDIKDIDVKGFAAWYTGFMAEYEQLNAMVNELAPYIPSIHNQGSEIETAEEASDEEEIIDIDEDDNEEEHASHKKTWVYIVVAAIIIACLALGLSKIISKSSSGNTLANNTNEAANEDPLGPLPESVKKYTKEDADKQFSARRGGMSNAEYGNYIDHETEQVILDINGMHDKIVYEMEKPAPIGGEVSWSRTVFKNLFEEYYQSLMNSAETEYEKESIAIDMQFEGGTGAGVEKMLTRYVIYKNVFQELEYRYKLVQQMP